MQTNNFYKYKPRSSFCRMFWRWLVMEFQNPAPEAGRLLKTAQILDRSKHVCVGALPRWLQETTALGGRRGKQRERGWPGPMASSGNSSPGSFSLLTPWEPPAARPKRCSRAEPSPNENMLSGKSPCSSYETLWFLLWKHKCILSNVNLLCTFKPTCSAGVSGNIFARTSKIH